MRGTRVDLETILNQSPIAKLINPIPYELQFSNNNAILFTDIIGSSAIYKEYGDFIGIQLATKKFALANEVCKQEKYNNKVGIVKTMGDALFIICENSSLLLDYAIDFIKLIKKFNEECEAQIKLKVRFTFHYGNFMIYRPPFQEYNDCFGEVINTTARLEGQNKYIISKKYSDDKNNIDSFPILMSKDFFSELQKEIDNCFQCDQHLTVIREYYQREFVVFIANGFQLTK